MALADGVKKYEKITGKGFTAPTQPDDNPQIAPHATSGDVAMATRKHDAAMKEWDTYNNTIKALLTQLIKAVPRHLIAELADGDGDFTDRLPHETLDFLWKNHGTITPAMLKKNMNELKQPNWKLTDPITNLWAHTKKCTDFADEGKEPTAETIVVRALEKVFKDSGAFELDIHTWENRKLKKRTLDKFKIFFAKANQIRAQKATAASEGCAGAAATPAAVTPSKSSTIVQKKTNTNMQHCWSHGLNDSHDSPACNGKADGHEDGATVNDMMGGNNMIQRGRGEKRKFEFRDRDDGKKKKGKTGKKNE